MRDYTILLAEFSYDPLDRRTTKTTYNDEDEAKKIIRYTYSGQDAIQEDTYAVRNNKEVLKNTKEYLYGKGIDDVLAMLQTTTNGKKTQTKAFFYQKDQLGSIIAITDETGNLLKQYAYDEFGKAYERKEKGGHWNKYSKTDLDNSRLFTGREYDKETGLYYYRARYYSANLGRFLGRDPIGTKDDRNLYAYVGNNPVGYVDAMGREKTLLFIGKSKAFFSSIGGEPIFDELELMAEYQYKQLINSGYRKENISVIYTDDAYDFISMINGPVFYNNITIISHASAEHIDLNPNIDNKSKYIDQELLQKYLAPKSSGQTITIIGCNSGAGENSIAQSIANYTGDNVYAPK